MTDLTAGRQGLERALIALHVACTKWNVQNSMTSTEPTPQDSDDGTANTESAPEKKSRFEAAQDTFDTSQTLQLCAPCWNLTT